jgi:hypothetical protein
MGRSRRVERRVLGIGGMLGRERRAWMTEFGWAFARGKVLSFREWRLKIRVKKKALQTRLARFLLMLSPFLKTRLQIR